VASWKGLDSVGRRLLGSLGETDSVEHLKQLVDCCAGLSPLNDAAWSEWSLMFRSCSSFPHLGAHRVPSWNIPASVARRRWRPVNPQPSPARDIDQTARGSECGSVLDSACMRAHHSDCATHYPVPLPCGDDALLGLQYIRDIPHCTFVPSLYQRLPTTRRSYTNSYLLDIARRQDSVHI